ncbi:Girdin, partial [Fragariocoptes setiger]
MASTVLSNTTEVKLANNSTNSNREVNRSKLEFDNAQQAQNSLGETNTSETSSDDELSSSCGRFRDRASSGASEINSVSTNNNSSSSSMLSSVKADTMHNNSSSRDCAHHLRELNDLKQKVRRLHEELDDKDEIIVEFKDMLEQSKEQCDDLKKDNIRLLQDARHAQTLRDENDILQEKLLRQQQLETDIERYKERIKELEYYRLRVTELDEDCDKLNETRIELNASLNETREKLQRIPELEAEINKWRTYGEQLNQEKETLQARVIELVNNEEKISVDAKRAQDELMRLRAELKQMQDSETLTSSLAPTHLLSSESNDLTANQNDTQEKCQDQSQSLLMVEFQRDQKYLDLTHTNDELTASVSNLKDSNRRLEEEVSKLKLYLVSSKQIVKELRQDLTSEKSITEKLNRQLQEFEKTIKSLYCNKAAKETKSTEKSEVSIQAAIGPELSLSKTINENESSDLTSVSDKEPQQQKQMKINELSRDTNENNTVSQVTEIVNDQQLEQTNKPACDEADVNDTHLNSSNTPVRNNDPRDVTVEVIDSKDISSSELALNGDGKSVKRNERHGTSHEPVDNSGCTPSERQDSDTKIDQTPTDSNKTQPTKSSDDDNKSTCSSSSSNSSLDSVETGSNELRQPASPQHDVTKRRTSLPARNSLLNSSASGAKMALASPFVRNACPTRSINVGHLHSYRTARQATVHASAALTNDKHPSGN